MDNMTIINLTCSWLKFNDMSLFIMHAVTCTQTFNLNVFNPKGSIPVVYIDVSCVGRCCIRIVSRHIIEF